MMEKDDHHYEIPFVVEIIVPKTPPTIDDFLAGLTLFDERPPLDEGDYRDV